MFDGIMLKDLLDLGTTGLLTFFLYKVWERLTKVTDRLLDLAEQAQAERLAIARLNGLEPQALDREAALIRRHMNGTG